MSVSTISQNTSQTSAQYFSEFFIPDDLTELDQWILWRYETVNGRLTKVPKRTDGKNASTTNPGDWSDFETVLQIWKQYPRRFDGVGFVLTAADPFVGIDVDDCIEDVSGEPKHWCQPLLERFADTYAEISPSGLGIKIWCRGHLPANVADTAVFDGIIALFDHAKYFTVTAQAFRGAPLQIEDHAADVLSQYEALTHRNGALRDIAPDGGRIAHGTQHLSLVSLCGTLRRRGVCDEGILACLEAVNRNQCQRPGPLKNIERIVTSSRNWGRS
ncbi:MAG TPA: hypothetical protein VH351_15405 [Bryobacteraceae bacterium]|jgi:hypothetical protein|nr:hypothetical protein [Bryobacteraceae bacterium]